MNSTDGNSTHGNSTHGNATGENATHGNATGENATGAAPGSARYETNRLSPKGRKAVLVILVAIVVLLGAGAAYSYYKSLGSTDLEGQAIRYEALDDTEMAADISLTRDDPSEAAMCVIRARDREGFEVARREVYFPPTGFDSTVVTTKLRTSSLGGVVDVYGCTYEVPAYLGTDTPPGS
ncbi:DUF4307 domain-containing protein [Tomitella fengzijianii]|uniref:DUF4307 domain-containing protein n=1 Tax=Tomitella fengzijianii TaxID=2597660 RepID=A0A516X3B6_9ACTN|nr:DUF4307 domain-containing protein [Tomitella fengzijianii]QDQ97131.1 DUF4307 domain-containing protein [Tomitella fengzijianii]